VFVHRNNSGAVAVLLHLEYSRLKLCCTQHKVDDAVQKSTYNTRVIEDRPKALKLRDENVSISLSFGNPENRNTNGKTVYRTRKICWRFLYFCSWFIFGYVLRAPVISARLLTVIELSHRYQISRKSVTRYSCCCLQKKRTDMAKSTRIYMHKKSRKSRTRKLLVTSIKKKSILKHDLLPQDVRFFTAQNSYNSFYVRPQWLACVLPNMPCLIYYYYTAGSLKPCSRNLWAIVQVTCSSSQGVERSKFYYDGSTTVLRQATSC